MASSTRDLMVHISSNSVVSINIKTNAFIENQISHKSGFLRFFQQLEFIYYPSQIKAIAVILSGTDFSNDTEFYQFRLACRDFCQKHGIFCCFPFQFHISPLKSLTQTKTMVKEGEKVLNIFVRGETIFGNHDLLLREKHQYRILDLVNSQQPPYTQKWRDDLIRICNPAKIVFTQHQGSSKLELLKHLFKEYNPDVCEIEDITDSLISSINDSILHLLGEKINPFHVALLSSGVFQIRIGSKSLLQVTLPHTVPFEETIVVKNNQKERISLSCSYTPTRPRETVKEINLSTFKSKKVKVIFKLDINSFWDFVVEPFNEKNEETSSSTNAAEKSFEKEKPEDKPCGTAKIVVPEKVRMIFGKHEFSVLCFANGKESNVKDKDGIEKTPIYISFVEAKPVIGKSAMEIYAHKPNHVVFDLIKLCSVTTDDIFNPKWGFRLSKEDETLIVTMQTLEDERKSTVAFLLALILKNGRDRIKKENGKRIYELEIGFDGFQPNETLKENFVEAGKLLKIGIVFV